MSISNPTLWTTAESNCFDYLCSITQAVANRNAFLGRLPAGAYNSWSFAISGGGQPLDFEFNMNTPGGCGDWEMSAIITGIFVERAAAQHLAGLLRANLPMAEASIDNVRRIRPSAEPRLIDDALKLGNGEMIQVWRLEYEFSILFEETT